MHRRDPSVSEASEDFSQAFEAFFKMPESYIHEKRHEALYRCGESLIKLNKYSEAVGRYDTLIRNYEKSSFFNNALFRRGTLRFLLKDPGRAIAFECRALPSHRSPSR